MNRRKYLCAVGLATGLAGCTGGSEEIDGGSRDKIDTEADTETDAPEIDTEADTETDAPDTATEEGEPEETPTEEPTGQASLEIVEHELVVEEGSYSTDVWVAATIENTGNAPSGQVELQADWYDEDGNYLDNDTTYLQSLPAGETWSARVYHFGSGAEDIADYEIEGGFDSEPRTQDDDGLKLLESEMNASEDDVTVTGRIENQRDENIDYLEVIATIYDANGVIIGDAWTNVTDFRAGETWRFEVSWYDHRRYGEAADHTIAFTASVY